MLRLIQLQFHFTNTESCRLRGSFNLIESPRGLLAISLIISSYFLLSAEQAPPSPHRSICLASVDHVRIDIIGIQNGALPIGFCALHYTALLRSWWDACVLKHIICGYDN